LASLEVSFPWDMIDHHLPTWNLLLNARLHNWYKLIVKKLEYHVYHLALHVL
jgi:hypothetical protein